MKGSASLVKNIRAGQAWISLPLRADQIQGAAFVVEHSLRVPGQAHLMLRIDFNQPVASLEGIQLGSLLLTINPHEREGEPTGDRLDGRHGIVYRALDGKAVEKLAARVDETWLTAWKLKLSGAEIFSILGVYIALAEASTPAERFHFGDHNCAKNLWKAIFAAVPRLLENLSEEKIAELRLASKRGANGAGVAEELGLLGDAVYPAGDALTWPGILSAGILRHLQNEKRETSISPLFLEITPKRNPLLRELYERHFLRADWLGLHLGDKLVAGKVVREALGESADQFYPACIGVKEFLGKYSLVDSKTGCWKSGRKELRAALREEFPQGFVLKACLTYGSKDGAFFHDEERILDGLLDQTAYREEDFPKPFRPAAEYGDFAVSSGEAFFLMGKINGTALAGESNEGRMLEIRAHSLEGHAVPGAVHSRWDGASDLARVEPRALSFVEDFLSRMPPGFRCGQAYSYDLFVPDTGQIQILEINTNRGQRRSWSDYLREPRTLAAHARLLQEKYGWSFGGVEGEILLAGMGNVVNHLQAELDFLINDENKGATRRIFWRNEMLVKNKALAVAALALRPDTDRFGYFRDVQVFAGRYLLAAELAKSGGDREWGTFVSWAKATLAESEAT